MAISIDGERARIVTGQRKGNYALIEDLLDVETSEISGYLRNLKPKKLYLHYEDRELIEEVFSLPPAKDRIIKDLIKQQLRRTVSEEKGFLFWYVPYTSVGQQREYLTIATDKKKIENILETFLKNSMYPEYILLNYLPLLLLTPESGPPVLLFYQNGPKRTIILTENRTPLLVRTVSGDPLMFTQTDVQHLNMTYNYCQQRMGITPEVVYIIGPQEFAPDINFTPALPIASLYLKQFKLSRSISMEDLKGFILPASMLLKPSGMNKKMTREYMPEEYRIFRWTSSLLKKASLLFIAIAIVLTAVSITRALKIKEKGDVIAEITRQTGLPELYNQYSQLSTRVNTLAPIKDILIKHKKRNTMVPVISMALDAMGPMVTLNSINLSYRAKETILEMRGLSSEDTKAGFLREMDVIEEKLKERFKKASIQKSYSIKDRTFIFTIVIRGR